MGIDINIKKLMNNIYVLREFPFIPVDPPTKDNQPEPREVAVDNSIQEKKEEEKKEEEKKKEEENKNEEEG